MDNLKNELDVLEDITRKLISASIPFMVTGSMAMNYHAIPRMTRDIDVIISIKKEDVEKLLSIFERDYYISRETVIESIERCSMFNIIHNESIIKADFIILKDVAYRHTEFGRRQRVRIRNFDTYIVTKEDLILSKLIWAKDTHSELQIRDIRNLMDTGFDEAYVQSWVKKLGIDSLFKEMCDG